MTKNEIQPGVDAGGVDALIRASLAGKRDWRVLARIILECERDGLWKGKASSFSAWLKSFAAQLGIQISNLWRYRRAGKAAFVFWGDQGQRRIQSLMDMPNGVSPESIEILDKISRAAPAYLVKELAARLYDKDVSISELRSLWNKLKPALKGDARGRDKIAPSLSRMDTKRRGALFEELVAEALGKLSVNDIFAGNGKERLKVLSNFQVMYEVFGVDVVMVVIDENGRVDIHGVQVCMKMTERVREPLQRLKRYCDFVWVALPEQPSPDIYHYLDDSVGLIQVRELRASVIRKPKRIDPELGGVMARGVITKLMQ